MFCRGIFISFKTCFDLTSSQSHFHTASSTCSAFKMPKKSGGKNSSSSKGAPSGDSKPSTVTEQSPIVLGKDGDISISIQVKPGAKQDAVTDITENAVGIQISSPPVDGEANTAIVKYFAEILKLKKADVSLKGGKSRQKTILVSSSTGLTSERVMTLLKTEMQNK